MNFAELRFWELLAGCLTLVFSLRIITGLSFGRPGWFDKTALLFIGFSLLLAVSQITFLIFLAVALGSYFGLQWILRLHGRAPRRYLFILIPLQLAPLLYYKYGAFVMNGVLGQNFDSLRHLIIPVGISFYTFQKIAFVLDTIAYRQPLPRFLDYLNFAGFFPQIVAGPIERRQDLLPQMEQFRFRWSPEDINAGASWIVVGFFFKACLADNLATFFRDGAASNAYLTWMNSVLFGFRIYYDFAGYSLIALGLARCLGVRLTLNFASPYCSTNLAEFWRRWHITLSQWFRDYLYVPLGGNRTRWWAANLLIVFLVSGAWHGAGWNFIFWGGLHGLLLIALRLAPKKLPCPAPLAWAATMVSVFVSWLCFYETRVGILLAKLQNLLMPKAYTGDNLRAALNHWTAPEWFVLGCLAALSALALLLEWRSLRNGGETFHLLRKPVVLALLIVLTVWLAPGKNNGFIYFAF